MTINVCHTRKLTGKFNSPFTLVGEKLNSPVVVVTWFSRGRRDSPLFSFCTRLSELKVLARTRRRRKSTVTFLMHTTCTRSSHFHVHKRRAFFKKIFSHTNTPDPNRLASTFPLTCHYHHLGRHEEMILNPPSGVLTNGHISRL